jgi:hypothetical protein
MFFSLIPNLPNIAGRPDGIACRSNRPGPGKDLFPSHEIRDWLRISDPYGKRNGREGDKLKQGVTEVLKAKVRRPKKRMGFERSSYKSANH